MPRKRAQTLAMSNPHAKAIIRAVMAELLTGETRERFTDTKYLVSFKLSERGVIAKVDTLQGNIGAWLVKLEAL